MAIRSTKCRIATAGASLALVAAIVGVGMTTPSASAWASSPTAVVDQIRQAQPSPVPKPDRRGAGPQGQNTQDRNQAQQAYLNALAGRLGVTADQLQDAMKQARIDVINQAVAAGKLDQERANRMIQAIQSGQGFGQPGMRERGQRPGQPGPNGQGPQGRPGFAPGGPRVLLDILGMTPEQLRAEFQAGKSLAQIAEAKGISRDTLKTKLLEARKAQLDAAVAAGRITAEQAQQIAARQAANIDKMLDMTPGQRRGPRAPGATN